ncbi:hypothetical protein [Ktedonobacter racemifer]|nr:hypothetical protein [Ktedonobacter racemifer]
MSKSLDSIVTTLGTGVANERAKGPVQSYQDLKERVQRGRLQRTPAIM